MYCSHRWLFFTKPELISIVHHQTAFLSLWESLELVRPWILTVLKLHGFSQKENAIWWWITEISSGLAKNHAMNLPSKNDRSHSTRWSSFTVSWMLNHPGLAEIFALDGGTGSDIINQIKWSHILSKTIHPAPSFCGVTSWDPIRYTEFLLTQGEIWIIIHRKRTKMVPLPQWGSVTTWRLV